MRKLLFFSIVVACVCSISAEGGLLTHLEFEGDISDTTGNITYTGTPGAYVPGPAGFGQAMQFDKLLNGPGGYGNVVYAEGVGDALSTLNSQITISFWALGSDNLPYDQSTPTHLFTANDPAIWTRIDLQIPHSDPHTYVFYDMWGPAGAFDRIYKWIGDTPELYKGQWHHWAFVKDIMLDDSSQEMARMKIYVDGELWHESFTGPYGGGDGTQNLRGIENLYIGANKQYWDFYDGLVDDFRIYDEALSQTDIQSIMVPEPVTLCLLGLGGLLLRRRR